MSREAQALGYFAGMRMRVAEIDRKIAIVSAHRERTIAQRDHKHAQIPLRDAEMRAYQQKIDAAEAQLLLLVKEKSRMLGSPIQAPFRGQEEQSNE